ncbi:alpha-(1,6)-fucosyltransferase [Contarinia nasturtii]|uniref:alpha-(1,6)-fucosyltransferase n=1 Tax=Contarinia nasturtii TaxID=265458 RepID=UPI0012D3F1E9|nr:alpha-(1,6)-fucosyltransferase [Contarinia nasturtii]
MSVLRQVLGLSAWIRALVIFVLLWGLLVLIFASKLSGPNASSLSNEDYTNHRLNQAIEFLEESKRRNSELKQLIDEFLSDKSLPEEQRQRLISDIEAKLDEKPSKSFGNSLRRFSGNELIVSNGMTPISEYEELRRRVRSNVLEMYNYVGTELTKLFKNHPIVPELGEYIDKVMHMTTEHKRSLINDMDHLRRIDGYEQWRRNEAESLSDLVQRRLKYLQNPKDCSTARKLVCRLNKGCGYGCQLHHVVYCFIMAYATERTLILKSKGWRYHKNGWEEVFKPLSDTCTTSDGASHANWGSSHFNTQVVDLPIIDSLNPRPNFLPLSIPEDLAPRLKRLHGDPITWWVGQFLKYLLKFQPETQNIIDAGIQKLKFQTPIVGVHIRRTDKVGTEAALHNVDEYMKHVDEYYNQLEMVETVEKRRVFLASDDPKVIDEARNKYPQYEIIGDPNAARTASLSTRYTDSSLYGIILDIHLLSISDYLVCTFSSQVCRVAYEIMQTMYPDASHRFKSLDDIYYYGGQNSHNREAVLAHHPNNHEEIYMNVGDLIGVAGNHWDGFSKGRNTRTNQIGLFPSFKVVDKVETAEFPKYSNVK